MTLVVVNSWSRTQEAEEDVPRRPDHNARVPVPHDQIARLRLRYSLKPLDSDIEIVGACVTIGEASPLVDGMNQVRTVATRMEAHLGIQRGGDHG